MKEIYEQFILAFDADPDLSAMFPNGLFNDVGYDSQNLPVAIISGISEVPSWTTCSEISELLVQITVFTSTDSQCFDAIQHLKDEFDDIILSLSNASPIIVTRASAVPPRKVDDAWRGIVDFRIETQI